MILRRVLHLHKSIDEQRQKMHELANSKGLSDFDVLKTSQQLDEDIITLQKILLYGVRKEDTLYNERERKDSDNGV